MDHYVCDKCDHMGHAEGMCEECHEGHMNKCGCGDPDSHKKEGMGMAGGGDEKPADEGGE